MSDKLSLHSFTLTMTKISQNYNETELRSLWPKDTPQIRKLYLSCESILDPRQDKFFLLPQLWACMCVQRGWGLLVHFYLHFMHLRSLASSLYRRRALLCLVSSLTQHSWAASCQLAVLCVMVQGTLGCWGRGLSSLLMVRNPGGFASVTLS